MTAEVQDKKERDANRTREAILDAAERVFAEHGFDGARIDVIAKASGFNSGLIFRYFGDKVGLYTAVIERADREVSGLLAAVFAPLLTNEAAAADARQFRAFLEDMVRALFDYLSNHRQLLRILTWEMAEGWQTFTQIASRFPPENFAPFEMLFRKARGAGLVRTDYNPLVQYMVVFQICQACQASLPLYRILLGDEDLSSDGANIGLRDYLVGFIVAGLMTDIGLNNLQEK